MTTIRAKTGNLLFLLVMTGVYLSLTVLVINKMISGKTESWNFGVWAGLGMFLTIGVLLIAMLFKTNRVKISPDNDVMFFYSFFRTTRIEAADIKEYYDTDLRSKVRTYEGLLIKLGSGKVIEVTNYNLRSVQDIKAYMEANKVPYKGRKRSWYPVTKRIK